MTALSCGLCIYSAFGVPSQPQMNRQIHVMTQLAMQKPCMFLILVIAIPFGCF